MILALCNEADKDLLFELNHCNGTFCFDVHWKQYLVELFTAHEALPRSNCIT